MHRRYQEMENGEAKQILKRIEIDCEQNLIALPFDLLEKRLFEGGRAASLFGQTPFGESIMASEWRAEMSHAADGIEQTGTIAGYVKAIEQLMWQILILFTGKHLAIKLGKYGNWLPLTKEVLDNSLGSGTLGNLMHLFSHKKYSSFYSNIYCDPMLLAVIYGESSINLTRGAERYSTRRISRISTRSKMPETMHLKLLLF